MNALHVLHQEIIDCTLCARLVRHRERMAKIKRRAYLEWDYWGKPVPPFGDPNARMVVIGLAPAAHGGNRTGRMFTGDRSGDFLYRALFETGFANQPESRMRGDGLELRDAYITAAVRCAPPDNKPSRGEFAKCNPYLRRELDLLNNTRVLVALGKLAFDAYLDVLRGRGVIRSRAPFRFGHGVEHIPAPEQPVLIGSYHPSQQNTSTGRLTAAMLREVFEQARAAVERTDR